MLDLVPESSMSVLRAVLYRPEYGAAEHNFTGKNMVQTWMSFLTHLICHQRTVTALASKTGSINVAGCIMLGLSPACIET